MTFSNKNALLSTILKSIFKWLFPQHCFEEQGNKLRNHFLKRLRITACGFFKKWTQSGRHRAPAFKSCYRFFNLISPTLQSPGGPLKKYLLMNSDIRVAEFPLVYTLCLQRFFSMILKCQVKITYISKQTRPNPLPSCGVCSKETDDKQNN